MTLAPHNWRHEHILRRFPTVILACLISDICRAVYLIIITLAELIKITTTRHAPYFMIQSAEMLGVVASQCFMQANITQPTLLETSFIAFKYPVIAHLD